MQDELQALRSSATRVWDHVLERSNEMPSLMVGLSSTAEQIMGHVDAAAANRVHWEARLALPIVLSHFPELVLELKLLVSGYNVDLIKDEMESLWTQTRWALESLSSRVPPLFAHGPPDSAGKE
jgi:hypothetical protein